MVWKKSGQGKDLECRGEINKGSYGKVYRAYGRHERREFAVKQLRVKSDAHYRKLLIEVDILVKLNHPNVNRYFCSWCEGRRSEHGGFRSISSTSFSQFLYIKLELCTSNLKEYLQNVIPTQDLKFKERERIQAAIIPQILDGLVYIHDAPVIHSDIKPDNIFVSVSTDGRIYVKIGDFGLAQGRQDDEEGVGPNVGSELYKSPEMPGGHYDNKTDIFSMGLVFLEIIYAFKNLGERCRAFNQMRRGCYDYSDFEGVNGFTTSLKLAVRRMTQREGADRPSANLVLQIIRGTVQDAHLLLMRAPEVATLEEEVEEEADCSHRRASLVQFVGRHDELVTLQRLTENHPVVGIFGTSGIGKSSLCAQFVSPNLPRTIWLDASNLIKLRSSLLRLLKSDNNANTQHTNLKSINQLFKWVIKGMPPNSQVFVILDNYLDKFCPLKKGESTHFPQNLEYSTELNEKLKRATFQVVNFPEIDPEEIVVEVDHALPILFRQNSSHVDNEGVDLDEERNEMSTFVEEIATLPSSGRKVTVIITTVSRQNLPHFSKHIELKALSTSDALALISTSFGFQIDKSNEELAEKLLNFPLYIRQAGTIFRTEEAVHGLAAFSEIYLSNMDRIVRCSTPSYKCSLVPIPQIMCKLEEPVLTMLCILAYCPISLETSVLMSFAHELLSKFRSGGSTRGNHKYLTILESYGLVSVEPGVTKTITMHSLYQREIFNCLTHLELQDSFLGKLAYSLNNILQRFNNSNSDNSNGEASIELRHQYINLASSIWEIYGKNCMDMLGCLQIPLFLDNTCTQLFTKSRFIGLENIIENVVSEVNENSASLASSPNKKAFTQLSNRYIYSAAYNYMDFTKSIQPLLKVRNIMPKFCMRAAQNHSQFTGRIYLTFMVALAVFLVAMAATPCTLYTGDNDPYLAVSWLDNLAVSGMVAAAACVPGIQIYVLLTVHHPWIRALLQYSLMGIYIAWYYVYENAATHYSPPDSPRDDRKFIRMCIFIASYSLMFCHIAKPTLAIIFASIKFARKDERGGRLKKVLSTVKNCHVEFVNFVFGVVILTIVCYTCPQDVVAYLSLVEVYSISGVIVGVSFFIYFIVLVTIYRNLVSLSLKLSHKYAEWQANNSGN